MQEVIYQSPPSLCLGGKSGKSEFTSPQYHDERDDQGENTGT